MTFLFLVCFVNLDDVFVIGSSLNFADLEQEKNMPQSGSLRQYSAWVCFWRFYTVVACKQLCLDDNFHLDNVFFVPFLISTEWL